MKKAPSPMIVNAGKALDQKSELAVVGNKVSGSSRVGPNTKNWQRGFLHDGISPNVQKKTPGNSETLVEKHGVSAGFRIPNEHFDRRQVENTEAETLRRNQKEASKSDIFNILGIRDTNQEDSFNTGDFENKKTIKNREEIAEDVIGNIEKRLDKIRYNREKLIQKKDLEEKDKYKDQQLFRPRLDDFDEKEDMILNLNNERQQLVSHYASTLENPNLENVEALLKAHQKRLRDLEEKYYKRKRGLISPKNTKVTRPGEKLADKEESSKDKDSENEEEKVQRISVKNKRPKSAVVKKNKGVDKEKQEFKKRFNNYLEERKEIGEERKIEAITRPKKFDLVKGPPTDCKLKGTPKNPTLKESLVEDAEKRFKTKAVEESMKDKKDKKTDSDKKFRVENRADLLTKDEFELIKFFFEELKPDGNREITKLSISKYLIDNPKIMELYDMHPLKINRELEEFPSYNPIKLNFEEFLSFLKSPRDLLIVEETAKTSIHGFISQSQEEVNEGNRCLLSMEHKALLKSVFDKLDIYGELIVVRKDLITKLRNEVRVAAILMQPAVLLPSINDTININKVLNEIEQDGSFCNDEDKDSNEFITWEQFMSYFTNYRGSENMSRMMLEQGEKKGTHLHKIRGDDQEEIDMSENMMDFLKYLYQEEEKTKEGFVEIRSFFAKIRGHPEYIKFQNELARLKADKFNLKNETLGQVLARIEREYSEHIDWDDFFQFFTKRGTPL